jgi:hypothetical protein
MAGQYLSERELAILCLGCVILTEVENRAAGKPRDGRGGRRLSEREANESNLSILLVDSDSLEQLEMSRLRST